MTLTPSERLKLIQTLNAIAPEQLEVIIFTLSPPAGLVPSSSGSQGQRVAALLRWAESPGGCGLTQIKQVIDEIINNGQTESSFEAKYRQQIITRHGYITPPTFDKSQKVAINNLYICPNFSPLKIQKEKKEKSYLSLEELCSRIERTVILGDPGGGKSTLTNKICYELSIGEGKLLIKGNRLIPILVILRDYGAEKKVKNCSILQFICDTVTSKYQLPLQHSKNLENLLKKGLVIVIFDGLDELTETSSRQSIADDVEAFCSYYTQVPVLVTSRETGYNEAPLDERQFTVFRLCELTDDQIKNYLRKWFSITIFEQEEETAKAEGKGKLKKKVENFWKESQSIPDLRSNPLILSLLCNIYQGEGYIPRNRPDVYEKCADMLFARWDRSRGINISLTLDTDIQFVLMYLAYWIYIDDKLLKGVSERQLIIKATDYLSKYHFDNVDKAEMAARQFVEFCRGRAWIFTDIGTRKDGENLYQFTHQTFLEYFTAKYVVRKSKNWQELHGFLSDRIAKGEWNMVGQLAYRIQDKNTEGAGTDLLEELLQKAKNSSANQKRNLIFFTVQCLEFIMPEPQMRRKITEASLELCLSMGVERLKNYQPEHQERDFWGEKLLAALFSVSQENRNIVADTFEKNIFDDLNSSDNIKAYVALELVLYSKSILSYYGNLSTDSQDFWLKIFKNFNQTYLKKIEDLCPQKLILCIESYREEGLKMSLQKIIQCHGLLSLFREEESLLFPSLYCSSIAEFLLNLDFLHSDEPSKYYKDFEELADLFLTLPYPWLKTDDFLDFYQNKSFFSHLVFNTVNFFEQLLNIYSENFLEIDENTASSPDIIFCLLVICLLWILVQPFCYQNNGIDTNFSWDDFLDDQLEIPFLNLFSCTIRAYFYPHTINTSNIEEEFKRVNFKLSHKTFMWKWIRKEINLIVLDGLSM